MMAGPWLQVESSISVAMTPRYWNINTGLFLRRYVYERFGGGVAGLAMAQMVSGLWHGLREGHLLFFFCTIFLFQSSKGAPAPCPAPGRRSATSAGPHPLDCTYTRTPCGPPRPCPRLRHLDIYSESS